MYIRYLTEKEAVAAVGYAHRPYAIAAWRFLTKTGYINFGVAPPMAAKQSSRAESPKGTVIVIGAGMAGKMPLINIQHINSLDALRLCLAPCQAAQLLTSCKVMHLRPHQHAYFTRQACIVLIHGRSCPQSMSTTGSIRTVSTTPSAQQAL